MRGEISDRDISKLKKEAANENRPPEFLRMREILADTAKEFFYEYTMRESKTDRVILSSLQVKPERGAAHAAEINDIRNFLTTLESRLVNSKIKYNASLLATRPNESHCIEIKKAV